MYIKYFTNANFIIKFSSQYIKLHVFHNRAVDIKDLNLIYSWSRRVFNEKPFV